MGDYITMQGVMQSVLSLVTKSWQLSDLKSFGGHAARAPNLLEAIKPSVVISISGALSQ